MTTQNKNVPALRFPNFNGDWETKKLSEISKINPNSRSLPSSFIYIDLESVENGSLLKESLINLIDAPSRAQRFLVKSDILFQMVRPYQKNNLFFEKDGNYVASTGYAQIRTENDAKYLFQYLHTDYFVNDVLERCTGTSYPAINSTDLANIKINFPTLPEQQKIAAFLTAVDEKIQQLTKKKDLLEQYKKGVMQKIFNQEIRFNNTNGNDFADWEEKTLGEVSKIKRGASPRPISDKKWFDGNSVIGWVRISDVTKSNKFLTKTEQYLSQEGIKKSRLVKKGNLIMSICATIGKPIYTNFDVCIHDGFVVFEGLTLDREFLYYYLDMIQLNWYKYGQPGSQVNLNSDIVSSEIIPVPSIAEQQKIVKFLSAIDDKINLVNQQLEKTKEYKKGLLQKMFV